MNNLHAVIHEAVLTDISRLVGVQRTSTKSGDEWDHKTRYEFNDGAKVELSARYADAVVFPAVAGFELLTIERTPQALPTETGLARQVSAEPILAWSVSYDHGQSHVEAITTSGWETSAWARTFKAIRLPGGQVQWHAPFDLAACSVFNQEFGPDEHRCKPIVLTNTESWLDFVKRVWLTQVEEESRSAQHKCPDCGRGHVSRDDDMPF